MGKQNDRTETDEFVDLFDIGVTDLGGMSPTDDADEPEGDVTDITDITEEPEEIEPEPDEPADEPEPEPEPTDTDDTDTNDSEFGTILQGLADDGIVEFDVEKEYEPNVNGFKDIVKQTVEKAKEKALGEFLETLDPESKEAFEIIKSGGTINDYLSSKQDIDFSKIPLVLESGEAHERNQEYLVEDWLKVQGYDASEIEEKIADLKEAGLLEKEAKTAKTKLVKWQETEKEKKKVEIQQSKVKRDAEIAEARDKFKQNVLSKRDIAGFKITDKQAEKLYDFITKPTVDGKTQFAKTDTEENRLLYAFFAMQGFDKTKLEKEIQSKQNLKLKKDLSNFNDTNARRSASDKRIERTPDSKGINFKWITD